MIRIPSLAPFAHLRQSATNPDKPPHLQALAQALTFQSLRQVATRFDPPRLKSLRVLRSFLVRSCIPQNR